MRRVSLRPVALTSIFGALVALLAGLILPGIRSQTTHQDPVATNAVQLVPQGRQIFRMDTFGHEAFWGGTLKLPQAIEGAGLGGVGAGVSPVSRR
jgi:hypothetical protein